MSAERTPWPIAGGGPVVLSQGALTLTAQPESVDFGIGVDANLSATLVDFGSLPPYLPAGDGPALWALPGAESAAFLLTPLKITASSAESLTLDEAFGNMPVSEIRTQYDLYAVDPDTAIAGHVGTATEDETGLARSAADSTLTQFSALFIVKK